MSDFEVVHNAEASRFEVALEGELALVEYMLSGNNMVFTHTEVPEKFEGRGVANQMAKVALDYAVAQGYKIQAVCPFIVLYVQKHKEYQPHTWGYEQA